ncbi:AMP-binding protein, partial [Streptomyces erythrochromogenes]|uniref:AMP-binding protein n=1 Tax=Streptomyces erythrochromogenes TaxID=285574 RepID=UPI0036CDE20D
MREITVPPIITGAPVGGLADVVFQHAREEPDRVVLGRKTDGVWRDVTSGELAAEVLALAKGLLAQGVRFGDRVAVMSRTRYEFTLFDFALWAIGAQPVPVYPTSSTEQVHWILYDTDCTACVVENEDQAMTVGSVIDRLPHLRLLWQLDAGAVDALVADGRSVAEDVVHRHRGAVTPDATATVIYTSGTTGRPKGWGGTPPPRTYATPPPGGPRGGGRAWGGRPPPNPAPPRPRRRSCTRPAAPSA